MTRVLVFAIVQIAVSGYALLRGGAPERLTALALACALSLTLILQAAPGTRFYHVEHAVWLVDLGLFATLFLIALYADRWWPLWVAALQGLGVIAHLVKAINPDTIRVIYAILIAAWSYPILLLLVVGTFRHQRRKKRDGGDLHWSRDGKPGEEFGEYNVKR